MFKDSLLIAQAADAGASAVQTATDAGAAPAQAPAGSMFGPFGIIIILGVMIFLMFRSQKKEARKRQEMLNSIKTGDKVVTAGGIYGEVTVVKNDSFVVKIAENVKIEVCKTGVSTVVDKTAPAESKDSADNKDSYNNKDSKK